MSEISRRAVLRNSAALMALSRANGAAGRDLFLAEPLTPTGSFTQHIEGPACDAAGNIYAVSYERQPTIGKITAKGDAEVFLEMPEGSLGNGIRFDAAGQMYVADYTGHNILRVDPATRKVDVYAHEPAMSQPNDITITAGGIIYASDPNWDAGTGRIWRCGHDRKLVLLADALGTTNGIELSPDGRLLYVSETQAQTVFVFDVDAEGGLSGRREVIRFREDLLDGMRCDVEGNFYVTRYGNGTVAKVTPEGKLLHSIDVLGANPTNVCFGGPDGRTCYVTEAEKGRLVQFRVDVPGLEWQRWQRG